MLSQCVKYSTEILGKSYARIPLDTTKKAWPLKPPETNSGRRIRIRFVNTAFTRASKNQVNIGSGNALLPDGTKELRKRNQ